MVSKGEGAEWGWRKKAKMDKRDQMYGKEWKLNLWLWTCCGYTEAEIKGGIPETHFTLIKTKPRIRKDYLVQTINSGGLVIQSCLTLVTPGLSSTRLLCP